MLLTALMFFIAIIVFIIAIRNYRQGFIAVVVVTLLTPYFIITLGGIKLTHVFLFALLVSFMVHSQYKKGLPFPKVITKNIALFVVSSVVLIFLTATPWPLQFSSVARRVINMFALGILGWFAFPSLQKIKSFAKIITYCVIVICLYGLFEYISMTSPYATAFQKTWSGDFFDGGYTVAARGVIQTRVGGVWGYHLAWGQTLTLIYGFLLMIRASVKPAVFYTANVLLFINIIMSGSRSAFVGLLFFSFFAFFSYFSWKKILVIGIGILAFLAIPKSFPGIGAAADTMKAFVFVWDDSASKDIEAGGSSFEARQEQLTRSFEIASAFTSPLVGVGSGYLENFADTSTLITNDLLGLESILFGMLIEQGILGVLFYFFLFFQLYFFTKRLQKQAGIKNYMPEMYYFSYCVGIIMTGVRSNYDIFFVFALIYIKYLYFQSQISR